MKTQFIQYCRIAPLTIPKISITCESRGENYTIYIIHDGCLVLPNFSLLCPIKQISQNQSLDPLYLPSSSMAVEDHSLSAPLLSSSEQPPHHHIVTVHDQPQPPIQSGDANRHNPYAFVGAHHGFEVPASVTIDPYRNHTPNIEGFYEWLKILLCLPLAPLRLVLFGLCLMLGYLTTRLALYGWKDRQNPMPRWRCRLMRVTRFSGRAILFSFG